MNNSIVNLMKDTSTFHWENTKSSQQQTESEVNSQ